MPANRMLWVGKQCSTSSHLETNSVPLVLTKMLNLTIYVPKLGTLKLIKRFSFPEALPNLWSTTLSCSTSCSRMSKSCKGKSADTRIICIRLPSGDFHGSLPCSKAVWLNSTATCSLEYDSNMDIFSTKSIEMSWLWKPWKPRHPLLMNVYSPNIPKYDTLW